jgi:hypothetical protein
MVFFVGFILSTSNVFHSGYVREHRIVDGFSYPIDQQEAHIHTDRESFRFDYQVVATLRSQNEVGYVLV